MYQQRFNIWTTLDSEISTVVPLRTTADTWPYKFGTHLRPEITWQNFVSFAWYCWDPVITASAETPPPPPCWDLFDATTAAPSSMPPLEHHRPHPAMLHRLPHTDGCWPPRGPHLLRSRLPLPWHQRLLLPWPGPLPVKQHAPAPQASIGERCSGELPLGPAHHVLYFSLILLFISILAYFILP
jgi:hypothetical protein